MTNPTEEVLEHARETGDHYAGDEDRPLGGYLTLLGGYALTVAGFATALKLTGRKLPERLDERDLVLAALATHKLARLVSKDPVTSPLRAPFTRFAGVSAAAELEEDVRGSGTQKAVGELLTCPFCIGHWIATGFAFGLVLVPRPTRLVAWAYATLAGSDLLQYAYAILQQHSEQD